jgi:hypothetical protein
MAATQKPQKTDFVHDEPKFCCSLASSTTKTVPVGEESPPLARMAPTPAAVESTASSKNKKKQRQTKFKHVTRKQANALVIDSGIAIQEAMAQLEHVRALAAKAGLSVDCNTLPRSTMGSALADGSANNVTDSSSSVIAPMDPASAIPSTTGGHSNTDHTIVRTGDERTDRVSELRRNLWRRHRLMQPETRQEGRWDKPRLPGERRRRIVRERDLPEAPPEPPLSGYIAFLGQMTVKLRHDRPDTPHDQSKGMLQSMEHNAPIESSNCTFVDGSPMVLNVRTCIISDAGSVQTVENWLDGRRAQVL